MSIINPQQPSDEGNAPLPVPPPERLARIFAFTDRLFELYGEDRSAWPPADRWPWEMLTGGAA